MNKENIPKIKSSSPKLKFISNEEWDDVVKHAVPYGKWHFERFGRGVKPVSGEYDPNNPDHIRVEDVITIAEF